jgi:hypothetical protein
MTLFINYFAKYAAYFREFVTSTMLKWGTKLKIFLLAICISVCQLAAGQLKDAFTADELVRTTHVRYYVRVHTVTRDVAASIRASADIQHRGH